MLHLIRKYRKSLLGALLVGIIVLAMLPFGSGLSGNSSQVEQTAIKIDDTEISFVEYQRKLEQVQRMISEQLGQNYKQFAAMMNIEQQTIDDFINTAVLTDFSQRLGMGASTAQVEGIIAAHPYFNGNVTREEYDNFLRAQGITGAELEKRTRQQLVAEQLRSALSDLSVPTDRELREVYRDENRKASFRYIAFSAAAFRDKVDTTKTEEIEKFFQTHAEEYRRPRAVAFMAVPFDSAEYLQQVEVTEEDLQTAYGEQAHTLVLPARIKLRRIVVYKKQQPGEFEKMLDVEKPAAADAAQEAKAKIEKARAELTGDRNFADVAASLSEEPDAGKNGGDMGWKLLSELDPKVRSAVAKLDLGEHSATVDFDDNLQIYYVDNREEKRIKPFAEVRAELEQQLRRADAPEYANAAAQAFMDKWEESGIPLKEFAEKEGKSVISTERPLARGEGAPNIPAALSDKAGGLAEGDRDIFQAGDKAYVVHAAQVKDAHIPELNEVRAQVEEAYRKSRAAELAKEEAEKTLRRLQGKEPQQGGAEDAAVKSEAPAKTLEQLAAEAKVKVEATEPATRAAAKGPLFSLPEHRRSLFTLNENNRLLNQVLAAGETNYVVELASSAEPDEKEFEKTKDELRARELRRAGSRLLDVLLKTERTQSDIFVNPELLNKQNRS